MKRIVLMAFFAAVCASGYAQVDLSALARVGYQTGTKRVGFGLEGRYAFQNNIRIAPEIVFFVRTNQKAGLDLNLDFHYLIAINPIMRVYPLIGGAADNNYYFHDTGNTSETHFGVNLGAGLDYDLNKKNYLNTQFRYTLNKYNYGFFSVGYGIRF